MAQPNDIKEKKRSQQFKTVHYMTRHSLMLTEKKGVTQMAENFIRTWRTPGLYKADVEKVYGELCEIGDEFTPQDIVDAARDESKELHKCFTWDNDIAANKYRLWEARRLTSEIVFKREVTENELPPAPVRVFNKTDHVGGYKIPERTFKVQEEYEALLQRALAELRAFKLKYQALTELEDIFALIP